MDGMEMSERGESSQEVVRRSGGVAIVNRNVSGTVSEKFSFQ